ncbi:MAG: STN domain-containing protein [Robiginitomaculum sp.]
MFILKNKILAAVGALLVLNSFSMSASGKEKENLHISAQPLPQAIERLASLTHADIQYEDAEINTLRSAAVEGVMSVEDALKQMVGTTGVRVVKTQSNVYFVLANTQDNQPFFEVMDLSEELGIKQSSEAEGTTKR